MFKDAHKNRLIETILLSTQTDVMAEKYEKSISKYALLSGDLTLQYTNGTCNSSTHSECTAL